MGIMMSSQGQRKTKSQEVDTLGSQSGKRERERERERGRE
jgi:hypothetical protein